MGRAGRPRGEVPSGLQELEEHGVPGGWHRFWHGSQEVSEEDLIRSANLPDLSAEELESLRTERWSRQEMIKLLRRTVPPFNKEDPLWEAIWEKEFYFLQEDLQKIGLDDIEIPEENLRGLWFSKLETTFETTHRNPRLRDYTQTSLWGILAKYCHDSEYSPISLADRERVFEALLQIEDEEEWQEMAEGPLFYMLSEMHRSDSGELTTVPAYSTLCQRIGSSVLSERWEGFMQEALEEIKNMEGGDLFSKETAYAIALPEICNYVSVAQADEEGDRDTDQIITRHIVSKAVEELITQSMFSEDFPETELHAVLVEADPDLRKLEAHDWVSIGSRISTRSGSLHSYDSVLDLCQKRIAEYL